MVCLLLLSSAYQSACEQGVGRKEIMQVSFRPASSNSSSGQYSLLLFTRTCYSLLLFTRIWHEFAMNKMRGKASFRFSITAVPQIIRSCFFMLNKQRVYAGVKSIRYSLSQKKKYAVQSQRVVPLRHRSSITEVGSR